MEYYFGRSVHERSWIYMSIKAFILNGFEMEKRGFENRNSQDETAKLLPMVPCPTVYM